jgi:hypothetical protein
LDFFALTGLAVSICLLAMTLAVLLPRRLYGGLLRRQVRSGGGHVFTPDRETWQGYLARTSSLGQQVLLLVYAGLLAGLILADAGSGPLAASVGLGVYLVLRHFLSLLPPTYGVTGKGVTVLSWLPNFPLGPFGSGSVFIPWTEVEICAMDSSFFVVLTEKQEARVVYPPELEEKVCRFVDGLLRRRGYEIG